MEKIMVMVRDIQHFEFNDPSGPKSWRPLCLYYIYRTEINIYLFFVFYFPNFGIHLVLDLVRSGGHINVANINRDINGPNLSKTYPLLKIVKYSPFLFQYLCLKLWFLVD